MKIAIVDQFPVIRSGLEMGLKKNIPDIVVISEAAITARLYKMLDASFDLLIIGLNEQYTRSVVKQIKAIKSVLPDLKIIVIDDHPCMRAMQSYFESGVSGYISKQSDFDQVLICFNQVMAGERYAVDLMHLFPE